MNSLPFTFFVLLCCVSIQAQDTNYQLVWADEFEGNGAINTEKWFHQTQLPNGQSWYNGEIQHYTNREDNAFVSGGILKLVAKKETYTDQGVTKQYTSARLNSKFAFTYGKVEVRAKLPTGVGTWPAIWTLGQNITEPGGYWTEAFGSTAWPACGELDIMEHWGDNQNFVQSAIHTPSSFGNTINKGGQLIPNASTGFHRYTIEWTEEKIIFSVDGVEHYTYEPEIKNNATWPFDAHQYLLLNIAIQPSIAPSFNESTMEIDYVHVYQNQLLNITNLKKEVVLTYPNPTNNILQLEVPSNYLGKRLSIYSVGGKKVVELLIEAKKQHIEVSGLEKGTYFLNFENENNMQSIKFIKS